MSFPKALPFLFHTLIELPASASFFFNPSSQLPTPFPPAHALIKQYSLLLFSSTLISLLFSFRPIDRLSRNVAGALAVYHFGPLVRAAGGILAGEAWFGGGLGGPAVHFIAHGVCLAGLGSLFLGGRRGRGRGKGRR